MSKSINPYVTVKGNILVSKCCGSEMLYRVSEAWDGYNFDMSEFCPYCLDCCETLEVKSSDYDRDLYLDKHDNFNYESYDSKNYFLIPKCDSEVYTKEEYEIIKEARLNDLDITLDGNGDIYEIKNKDVSK